MHLGLNLTYLHPKLAGVRIYGLGLARAIVQEAANVGVRVSLFVPSAERHWIQDAMGGSGDLGSPDFIPCSVEPRNKIQLLLYEQLVLPFVLRRHRVSHLYSFDYRGCYLFRGRQVASVLDVNFRDHPRNFSRFQRVVRSVAVPATLRLCDGVATLSEFSRRRIEEYYCFPSDKIRIIPPGIDVFSDDERVLSTCPAGVHQPYILSVGTVSRHKNFVRLIRAFAELPPSSLRLVIAGKPGTAWNDVRETVRQSGLEDRVVLTGFVSDSELEALYRDALFFVFPSEYEGFGIPVLEAMVRGLRVACSDSAALPEITDGAAVLFDPRNVGDIRSALSRLLEERAEDSEDVERSKSVVGKYSWSAAARSALKLAAKNVAGTQL